MGNRNQNLTRRRHHEPNPQDELPWLRTRFDRERYENWRESAPVLDSREIQYPVGNQYVAVVHSRTACRKPFLVDYERTLQPSGEWQPTPRVRLNWQEPTQRVRLSWQENTPEPRRIAGSNRPQLNWRDSQEQEETNQEQRNRAPLNWRDVEE